MENTIKIPLQGGGSFLIDREDEFIVSDEGKNKWKKRNITNQTTTNVYIEMVSRPFTFVHHLLLEKKKSNERLIFLNKDRLDYRKENIMIINRDLLQGEGGGKSRGRPKKYNNVSFNFDDGRIIYATFYLNRSPGCILCSVTNYDDYYGHCLEVAASQDWNGWQVKKMSDWCRKCRDSINTMESKDKIKYNLEYIVGKLKNEVVETYEEYCS